MNELAANSFIYEFHNALEPEFCRSVIQKFEDDPNKGDGLIGVGVGVHNPDIKSSSDLSITGRPEWEREDNIFFSSLSNIFRYFHSLVGHETEFDDSGYAIQRTNIGQKYDYHVDYSAAPGSINRILTIIWYLNDVKKGGETEFRNQEIAVQPEVGKAIVFPPYWTHVHRGLTPISNTKYICTTWMRLKM